MPAVAVTDHGNLFGAYEFFEKAKARGVKPIIGCELYVTPTLKLEKPSDGKNYHLTVLCMNEQEYRNLSRLVTRGYFEGFYRRPRVDHEMLSEHNEGLIVLSGCMSSELSQAIFKKEQKEQIRIASIYKEIFGDRYYLEVQAIALEEQRRVNRGLRRIGERLGIKLAATNDCHFLAAIWHRLISLPGNRIIRKSISSYPRRLPYMTTGICPALTIASPGLLTKQLKLGGLSKTPYSKKL